MVKYTDQGDIQIVSEKNNTFEIGLINGTLEMVYNNQPVSDFILYNAVLTYGGRVHKKNKIATYTGTLESLLPKLVKYVDRTRGLVEKSGIVLGIKGEIGVELVFTATKFLCRHVVIKEMTTEYVGAGGFGLVEPTHLSQYLDRAVNEYGGLTDTEYKERGFSG